MAAKKAQHTSQILNELVSKLKEKDHITLKQLVSTLGERSFGLLIIIFCIPNCLPIPNIAGLSAITGIPIILIGLQMILGREHLWMPSRLEKKKFSGPKAARIVKRAIPMLKKMEVLLKPRLQVMATPLAQRLLGVAFVALAVIMSLPVPFGNFMPGLGMALIAIGIIERDGLLINLGLVVGATTFVLMFTIAELLLSFWESMF